MLEHQSLEHQSLASCRFKLYKPAVTRLVKRNTSEEKEMTTKTKNKTHPESSGSKEDKATYKSEPLNPEQGYGDPLADVTRKERRNLLISDAVLIAVIWGSLVPTKIDALGIDLVSSERYSLIVMLFAVSFYFLVAFWLYARVDKRVWEIAYGTAESKMFEAYSKPPDGSQSGGMMFLGGPSDYVPEHHQPTQIQLEAFFIAWKKCQDVYHDRRLFDIHFPIVLTFVVWLACAIRLLWRGIS